MDGSNVEQLENATLNWIKVVKNAMDTAIPKSTHQYIYQLKTTPEIRHLEIQFKNLSQFATHFGWTFYTYREYLRIETELRENAKKHIIKTGKIRSSIYLRSVKTANNSGIKLNYYKERNQLTQTM